MSLEKFRLYLSDVKEKSPNTIEAYLRDLSDFISFLKERNKGDIGSADNADVVSYIMSMRDIKLSKATINRRISSLKAYYRFAVEKGCAPHNPAIDIKAPKMERKAVDFLSVEEIENILKRPDESYKGMRDLAMLEVMYGTGIKVSELIELKLSDVNMTMGFISVSINPANARIVPIGSYAKKALSRYISQGRPHFAKKSGEERECLFLNYMGLPFTRQGCWKIIKEYGKLSGIEVVSPHIFRNSFAVHMLQNGADVKAVQELLGNVDMQSMEIYLALARVKIRDVYNRTHPRA